MPPKKSSVASQKALLAPTPATPPASARAPLPALLLPASSSVVPLWTPHTTPRELFPEWPSAVALATENWCTTDAPFEDPSEFLCQAASDTTVSWKRPSQFLPLIVDPAPVAPPAPAAPEPKAVPAKKGAAPVKKAAAAEPEPAKKVPSKHAHVFYVDTHHDTPATPGGTQGAGVAVTSASHGTGAPLHPTGTASTGVHPATSDSRTPHHKIPRDFRRLWSADELEELAKWRLEEARIESERQHRERVYMGFEDAIAYIVNERSRGFAAEQDVDAEDLVDDGQDDDECDGASGSGSDALSNDSSPWGVIPPPRIEIAPNAVSKPEFPHGDVVHGTMAALFRIVESLFDDWRSARDNDAGVPFLWHAIYPQDASGVPMYNPGGKYSVKLFVLGKWRRVDIDDKLPVDSEGNIAILTSSMRSEIWPALLTKALLKVVRWLFGTDEPTRSDESSSTHAIRFVNTVVSALTGWKITRWQPIGVATRDPQLAQQLLEFVPGEHLQDEGADGTPEIGEQQEDTVGGTSATPSSSTLPTTVNPRALVCCTSERGTAMLCPRETALVTDIVGESDNATVKFMSLKGVGSVPEELITSESLVFLLVHPPFIHSDLIVQQWTATKTDPVAGEDPTQASQLRWTPFSNPATQFVLIKVPKSAHEQPSGDSSLEARDLQRQQTFPSAVEVVFTLTRIPPSDASAQTQDTRLLLAAKVAAYVPDMDPHGSVVLIQDVGKRTASSPASLGSAVAVIPPLGTETSTRVVLPVGAGEEDVVFKVHPQQSLCYGYGLQVEANVKVDFQEPSTCWRNVRDVQVVNSDGEYPVMLADTWNVLFKHTIELASPPSIVAGSAGTDGAESKQTHQLVDLFVDLCVSDAMLAPFVHIVIIDDETGVVTKLSSLCAVVSVPIGGAAGSHPFTVVADCAPQGRDVPEGKWHLTVGSNWMFKASSSHPMKLTAFEDRFVANKPLLLFRDVIVAPKKSIWTSFELKLLPDSNSSEGEELVDALAVKLEVIDAASEQLITDAHAMRGVRLLQLPRHECELEDDGKNSSRSNSGWYILQGTIDRARCVVPESLRSVRPFRSHIGTPQNKENDIVKESASEGDGGDGGDGHAVLTSFPSARLPSSIKWRLNCWSAEEVKLEVDRTKENRFEAIRAVWAEAAKERHTTTHGTVSRLLYMGKADAAEIKIRHDGVPEELAKRIKARFEWTAAATAAGQLMGDGEYLERRVRSGVSVDAPERMTSPKEFEEEERILNEEINAVQRRLIEKREARVAAKEQRAQEIKELVQSIREQRSAAVKARARLWQQRDAIIYPQSSA